MKELICIVCPRGCHLQVDEERDYAVTGNACPRGAEYGVRELRHPVRTLTSTVVLQGGAHRRLPVRTNGPIPKQTIPAAMDAINQIQVEAPVHAGQVLCQDLAGTGVELIATRTMAKI